MIFVIETSKYVCTVDAGTPASLLIDDHTSSSSVAASPRILSATLRPAGRGRLSECNTPTTAAATALSAGPTGGQKEDRIFFGSNFNIERFSDLANLTRPTLSKNILTDYIVGHWVQLLFGNKYLEKVQQVRSMVGCCCTAVQVSCLLSPFRTACVRPYLSPACSWKVHAMVAMNVVSSGNSVR